MDRRGVAFPGPRTQHLRETLHKGASWDTAALVLCGLGGRGPRNVLIAIHCARLRFNEVSWSSNQPIGSDEKSADLVLVLWQLG